MISAGEHVAERNCAECHAIGATGESPLAEAPTFRTLRATRSREDMAAIIDQRMRVIHPRMPHLALDEDEVDDFLDYWQSIVAVGAKAGPAS